MAEYHVGCGLTGIYAGTIKKPGEWKNKSEVTAEALRSVAEYMVGKIKPGGKAYEITWINSESGEKIILTCYREEGDATEKQYRECKETLIENCPARDFMEIAKRQVQVFGKDAVRRVIKEMEDNICGK